MDRCSFCWNILAYGENHTCSFLRIDSTNSHSEPFSENTSNSAQLGTPRKFHLSIYFQIFESFPKTNGNGSFTGSSENVESLYRPKNAFKEAFNISPTVMETTGVEEKKQRVSVIPDVIHATGRDEDDMSRQENKWLSLNNSKMNFMDSPECVIRTNHSDSSIISGPRNLVGNPDIPSGSNEPENGKKHFSEFVTDGYNSLEMHSNLYSKSRKTASTVNEHISPDTDNNAVAGPSGMCPGKKKYPCTLCPMEFYKKYNFEDHYRTHTREKLFVCKVCEKVFPQKGDLKRHIMTHTGEKPFVCEICKKAFSQRSHLNTHIHNLIHTAEKTSECKFCEKNLRSKCLS